MMQLNDIRTRAYNYYVLHMDMFDMIESVSHCREENDWTPDYMWKEPDLMVDLITVLQDLYISDEDYRLILKPAMMKDVRLMAALQNRGPYTSPNSPKDTQIENLKEYNKKLLQTIKEYESLEHFLGMGE